MDTCTCQVRPEKEKGMEKRKKRNHKSNMGDKTDAFTSWFLSRVLTNKSWKL